MESIHLGSKAPSVDESQCAVVAEALSFGAQGYVLKMRAGGDLLIAVEAVLEGKRLSAAV